MLHFVACIEWHLPSFTKKNWPGIISSSCIHFAGLSLLEPMHS